ncbi:DUF3320 domain-containing protein [uncultured Methanocorpusculum sp.]|nr:DUF3320 domain-containing protein [uncultured Methanocorpusculum sp.]
MEKGIVELEELRSRLLDLTVRNNLLNYKPSPGRSIEVIDCDPAEIYRLLVLEEKGMRFYPASKASRSESEDKRIWKYPTFSKTAKYADLILHTPYTDIELRKKLYSLQNKSRTVFEEQGYPVLYLALGFVEWTERDCPAKPFKAPLLLIPVELDRQKVKENYTLRWTGEDPTLSLSLVAKLAEQGVILPDLGHPETIEEISAYFTVIRETVAEKDWLFIPGISLDLFSFRKFVMFKDLDPAIWDGGSPLENNPLIKRFFHPEADQNSTPLFQENEVDLRLPSERTFNILDADSSQIAVIEEAKAGRNLVVEGPPGTGKSQTITNMIAEMLAVGKTVMFVSEKMAALEVVKRRLDVAGLSPYCLELHSQKAKKTELIRELEKSLQHPSLAASDLTSAHAQIDSLRSELDGYCNELKTPIGACGFTPYDLFGIREQYRYEFENSRHRTNYRLQKIPIENAVELTPDEYKATLSALQEIASYIPVLLKDGESLSAHPWAMTRPGMILPRDQDDIRELVIAYQEKIQNLQTVMRAVSDMTDIPVPRSETEVSRLIETCRYLLKEYSVTIDILKNPLWGNQAEMNRLIANMQDLYDHSSRILANFTPEIFLRNPARLYSELLAYSEKGAFGKIFSGGYKKLKADIAGYYVGHVPDDAKILSDLKDARNYLTARDEWEQDKDVYLSLFAPVWKDEYTNPDSLRQYADWVMAVLTMAQEGLITPHTIELLCSGKITGPALSPLFTSLEDAVIAHSEARDGLFNRLGIQDLDTDQTFASMRKLTDLWITEIDRLSEWSTFLTYAETCGKTTAAPVLPLLFTDKISAEALIPAYLTGYADALLKEAYRVRPLLARFAQAPHELKIKTFAEYDRAAISANAARIIQKLDQTIPEIYVGASRDSEMGVLTGEFNRKRGHMSIRTLMTKAGGLIQQIKPCFMMSPLSVAQYLDPRSVQFDIIIFDEASQVRPEDALGALMRGRQLVVMGDSRQLPPTTFFDQIAGPDEDDEESVAGIGDMESLLHVCKQSYPTRRLRWHYRSRHESLIAVSNEEFYDGSLMVFPSPRHETPDLGLSFVHLPNTIYERGKSGVNKGEAQVVAESVIEYYLKYPDKTLGVATFSTRQQDAIRHEVDVLLRTHPEVEMLMNPANGEHFFVKNLETVQGDERDTMLISIGYGFDENHRLSRNFGPLNQAGGERRLNVLITRARERCVVFSNFRGVDLQIDPDSSSGVAALSRFLTYAEDRSSMTSGSDIRGADDAEYFPDSVAVMLEDYGYLVSRNVGCAGFRIDIAVSDPKDPGVYMAGILCDGSNYWSSEVARDRDRLRIQVLEGLGWHLVRIWSAEWFQHPVSCTKILLDFLEDVQKPIEPAVEIVEEPPKTEPTPASPALIREETPEIKQPKQPVYARVKVEPYVFCSECDLNKYHQFSSVPDSVLATAILQIVSIEGPISLSMLNSRIKELGSVPKMTPAIKKKIASLAEDEVNADRLTVDDEGFYSVPNKELAARERPAKWSCSDVSLSEIGLAAEIILGKQFATPKSDLVRQTALVLGFKLTAPVKERMEMGIDAAISSGSIVTEGGKLIRTAE